MAFTAVLRNAEDRVTEVKYTISYDEDGFASVTSDHFYGRVDHIDNIFYVQASGEELQAVLEAFPHLPRQMDGVNGKAHKVQRWFDTDAKYALSFFLEW